MKKRNRKKTLKNKARTLAREVVRLRDKDTCQKCDEKVYGANSHPSHVYPKGTYRTLEFDVTNIKLLCSYCHRRWWHLNPMEAKEWFQEKFPERAEILRIRKQESFLVNETFLEQQIIKLKEQRAELMGEL